MCRSQFTSLGRERFVLGVEGGYFFRRLAIGFLTNPQIVELFVDLTDFMLLDSLNFVATSCRLCAKLGENRLECRIR